MAGDPSGGPDMTPQSVHLTIDSRLARLPEIGEAVRRFVAAAAIGGRDAFAAELCATEAVANCIQHAYGGQPGHRVEIGITISDTELCIEVGDTGTPMPNGQAEWSALSADAFEPGDIDSIPESGRGLAIIRCYMDQVDYHCDDHQNTLRMCRKLERQ